MNCFKMRSETKAALEGSGFWGVYFATLLSFLVLLSATAYSLSTVEEYKHTYSSGFLAVESVSTVCFTLEYCLRIWVADSAFGYILSPIALVDLVSFLPSWFDFFIPGNNFPALQFLRVIRLLKLLTNSKIGISACIAFNKSFREQKDVLLAATFAGGAVWIITSSILFLAEKDNISMNWCYPSPSDSISTEQENNCVCTDDISCTHEGCVCVHRFESIPSAMFFALLNLSGEFPLADKHSAWGRFICVCTAILSVGFFGIPVALIGSTIDRAISAMNQRKDNEDMNELDDAEHIWQHAKKRIEDMFRKQEEPFFVRYRWYKVVVGALCGCSVLASVVSTIDGINHTVLNACVIVDILCAIFFFNEHLARIASAGLSKAFLPAFRLDLFILADLISWAPTLVFHLLNLQTKNHVVLTVTLFRLVKFDRYINGFILAQIVFQASKGILVVGCWTTFCCLMICSAMMYYAERDNPDPDVRKYYQSVPDAMWITLLNLSGEAPLCDYSPVGKIIVSFLSVFAVAIFAVPIGALEAGFTLIMTQLNKELETKHSQGDTENDSEVLNISGEHSYRLLATQEHVLRYGSISMESAQNVESIQNETIVPRSLVRMVKGYGKWGKMFDLFSISTTFLIIIIEVLSTVKGVNKYSASFDTIETVVIMWFTVEFILRAACERSRYLCSKFCIVDALATFPWYFHIRTYDGPLRMLRLLRILNLDRYAPSITLLDDAVYRSRIGVVISVWLSFFSWYSFNQFLYLAENTGEVINYRFRNALSSAQFSAILLTSDYPLIDFSTIGKLGCGIAILVAVGIVGTPSALVASSFTDILNEKAEQRRHRRKQSALKLQKLFRQHLSIQSQRAFAFSNIVTETRKNHASQVLLRRGLALSHPSLMARYCLWKNGKSVGARRMQNFALLLILLNGLAVVLESIPSFKNGIPHIYFQGFESVSVAFFTTEYILSCLTSRYDPKYKFSVWCYAGSFLGIADFLSVAPFYMQMVLFYVSGFHFDATIFRIARILRIIEAEQFFPAFSLLDDVYRKVSPVLKATGVVAIFCWVLAATLFYYAEPHSVSAEDGNPFEPAVFTSIVDSLYYTAIFLSGEWAIVDFTPLGAVISIFTALVGTALFSIPVGAMIGTFYQYQPYRSVCFAKLFVFSTNRTTRCIPGLVDRAA